MNLKTFVIFLVIFLFIIGTVGILQFTGLNIFDSSISSEEEVEEDSMIFQSFENIFPEVQQLEFQEAIGGVQFENNGVYYPQPTVPDSEKNKYAEEILFDLNGESDGNPKASVPIIIFLKDTKNVYEIEENFINDFPSMDIEWKGSSIPAVISSISFEWQLENLLNNINVDYITKGDIEYKLTLAESRLLIKADVIENKFGQTGKGIGVCVIDSGVDYTHPALGGCTKQQFLNGQCSKVPAGYDFCDGFYGCQMEDNDPMDELGHGTHVAGIIASTDSKYKGIAPDAKIIAIKVFNFGGTGATSAVITKALDTCMSFATTCNIKVITNSYGSITSYSEENCPSYLDGAYKKAADKGIYIDVSSGNGARDGESHPACSPYVASIGASYDQNIGRKTWHYSTNGVLCDEDTSADKVTCFSNRGKDLNYVFPGSVITSTSSSDIKAKICGAPNSKFGDCSGTSMSSPHVAGTAALFLEKDSSLSPLQLDQLLKSYSSKIFDPTRGFSFNHPDIEKSMLNIDEPFINIDGETRKKGLVTIFLSDRKNKGMNYIMAFSLGTSPGITLPDNRVIPLNPDSVFYASLQPSAIGLKNSFGTLDGMGNSYAFWDIPPYLPKDLNLYASLLVIDNTKPYPQNILSISQPYKITIAPEDPINKYKVSFTDNQEISCNLLFNKIYCIETTGGAGSIYEDDPISGTTIKKSSNLPPATSDYKCVSVLRNNKIYCLGDYKYPIEYDPVSDKIRFMSSNPILPRRRIECEKGGNKIYCFGGQEVINYNHEDKIYEYDPINDKIIQKSATLPEIMNVGDCVYSSKKDNIYCFGGESHSGNYPNPVDYILEYDYKNDILKKLPVNFPELRDYYGNCIEEPINGKIFCFGGQVPDFGSVTQIVEFDPLKMTIQILTSHLPNPTTGIQCEFIPQKNKIHCFGGYNSFGIFLKEPIDTAIDFNPYIL